MIFFGIKYFIHKVVGRAKLTGLWLSFTMWSQSPLLIHVEIDIESYLELVMIQFLGCYFYCTLPGVIDVYKGLIIEVYQLPRLILLLDNLGSFIHLKGSFKFCIDLLKEQLVLSNPQKRFMEPAIANKETMEKFS